MGGCSIPGCKNRTDTAKKRVRYFFSFPTDSETLQKWLKLCPSVNERNFKKSRVCSAHFDTTDYKPKPEYLMNCINYSPKRRRILDTAIPTKNLEIDDAVQIESAPKDNDSSMVIQLSSEIPSIEDRNECNSTSIDKSIVMQSLPSDPERRKVWLNQCNLNNTIERKYACSKKILSDDYLPSNSKEILKQTEIPCLRAEKVSKTKFQPNILRRNKKRASETAPEVAITSSSSENLTAFEFVDPARIKFEEVEVEPENLHSESSTFNASIKLEEAEVELEQLIDSKHYKVEKDEPQYIDPQEFSFTPDNISVDFENDESKYTEPQQF